MSARPLLVALVATTLVAACAGHRSDGASVRSGVTNQNGAFVISGVALTDGRGSVLNTIEGKVPNFRIQRGPGRCPQISLRSHVTFQSVVNPHVYVDGTRSTDTCILESLRSQDVSAVEVYPMGVTQRPGYGTHAHGLILVFLRSG